MPKRGENIHKRKDGRWEARILTDTGKYKSVYASSYHLVKEKAKQPQICKAENISMKNISFEQICKNWMKECELKNKQSTVAIYKGIVNKHLIPYFNDINKIDRNSINAFIKYKMFQCKLSAKTVQDITAVLIQILKYAERENYISPINYDIIRPKTIKKELEVLTPSEQEILINKIKQDINQDNIGILLSLYAGLRIGEICALQWKDIDLKNGIISITKTMQRISVSNEEHKTQIIIDTPKSQKSVRKIPIPNFLLLELKRLSLCCSSNAFVLTGSENRFVEPRSYQYKFKKILENSKIRNINFHALRHTFATRAVEQNIDIKTLSEILGHSTIGFTLERYVHPSFELKKQSIEKLVACY